MSAMTSCPFIFMTVASSSSFLQSRDYCLYDGPIHDVREFVCRKYAYSPLLLQPLVLSDTRITHDLAFLLCLLYLIATSAALFLLYHPSMIVASCLSFSNVFSLIHIDCDVATEADFSLLSYSAVYLGGGGKVSRIIGHISRPKRNEWVGNRRAGRCGRHGGLLGQLFLLFVFRTTLLCRGVLVVGR